METEQGSGNGNTIPPLPQPEAGHLCGKATQQFTDGDSSPQSMQLFDVRSFISSENEVNCTASESAQERALPSNISNSGGSDVIYDALTLQKAATAGTTASGAIIGGVIAGPLWPVGAIVGGAVAYTGVVGGTVVYESLGSGTNGNESSVNVGNEEATALRLSPSTEALAALEQRELAAMEPRNVPVMSTQSSVDPRGSTIILTHYQADLISRLLRSSGLDNRDEYTSSLSRDNTGCCKSLVSRLWGLMRLFNIAGTVLGPRKVIGSDNEPDIVHRCMKILAARYLLCILILDSVAFLVGKVALFEILWLGKELGYSIVYMALVLSSMETTVEFASSAAMPRIYRLIYGNGNISLHRLVEFAVGAYFISSCVGLVFYLTIGGVLEIARIRNKMVFLLFIVAQAIHYPLLNQLGDQAIAMALPHWLGTFDRLVLALPGIKVGQNIFSRCCYRLASCCCCPRNRSKNIIANIALSESWQNNLLAYANEESLSYFVTLLRFVYAAIFSLIFLAVSDKSTSRWLVLIICATISVYSTGTMHCGFSLIKSAIADSKIKVENSRVPWIWEMRGSELALVVFSSVILSIPRDAVTAAITVVYSAFGAKVGIVAVVGGILVIYVLAKKILSSGARSSHEKSSRAKLSATTSSSDAIMPGSDTHYHPEYLMEIRSGRELGYAGFLNASDQQSLNELSQRVRSDPDLDKRELEAAMAVGSETWNRYLCRWLRARNFDVDMAHMMLREHIKWRIREEVTALGDMFADEALGLPVANIIQHCPHWVQGFDHQHRPYLFNAAGGLEADMLFRIVDLHSLERLHIWEQEQLTRLCGLKSAQTGYIVDRWVTVIDLKGVRLSQFTANCRALNQAFIKIDQAHYPERNGGIIIINAPIFFPLIFAFIQPLMNARTASRIKVFSWHQAASRLLLENLDSNHLLPEYGGTYAGDRDKLRHSGCSNFYMAGGNEYIQNRSDKDTNQALSTFKLWIAESTVIIFILIVVGFLMLWSSELKSTNFKKLVLVLCCVCLVPYFTLQNDIKSRIESMLMLYKQGQPSGIVHYRNLLAVLFKGPILVINWYVLEAMASRDDTAKVDDDEAQKELEQRQSGLVLWTCVALLVVVAMYFGTFDYFAVCGTSRSSRRLVDTTMHEKKETAN